MPRVFVSGGTGYMGCALVGELLRRGHEVRVLARAGSEGKVPPGAAVVPGDALDAGTWSESLSGCAILVHLVGVAHPSPAKAAHFRSIDLVSIRASVAAARERRAHLVYVSVAHPAPVMKEYIAVRAEGEELIRRAGLDATILRPWYVLGPGHRWPLLLKPVYWAMERLPATREGARRLGLVNLAEMTAALAGAVDQARPGIRIIEVPGIRAAGRSARSNGTSL